MKEERSNVVKYCVKLIFVLKHQNEQDIENFRFSILGNV